MQQNKLHNTADIKSCNLCLIKRKPTAQTPYFRVTHSITKERIQKNEDDQILLLGSSSLIDKTLGQKLLQLIKPLQNNPFTYRNPRFMISSFTPKPKLQDIISQMQHYRIYKQILPTTPNSIIRSMFTDEIPISSTPAIFSLKKNKFVNEINGLLYRDNTKLYALIEKIFIKFIPMFEWCLNMKLSNNKYNQLSVIIKIQDYQFNNSNTINGRWHGEGDESDNIIGVGVYYFDVTENEQLKFRKNRLEVAEREVSSLKRENIARIKINHNDCIVFKNSTQMQHRAIISTGKPTLNSPNVMVSRKMLTFFLMDPDNESVAKQDANNFKWINFPWKIEIFVKYFTGWNMDIYNQIPVELILLIKVFTFGNDKYLQDEMTEYELNSEPTSFNDTTPSNPFFVRKRTYSRRRMN